MSNKNNIPNNKKIKIAYSKPVLTNYGKIKSLTLGGSVQTPEGPGQGNFFKMP